MGLVDSLFGKQIQQAVNRQIESLYYENVYQSLNNGQPVLYKDNPETYIEKGYLGTGDVYTCVDKIVKKLVSAPPLVYEVLPDKVTKVREWKNLKRSNSIQAQAKAKVFEVKAMKETYIKEINDLLENPNKTDGYSEFVENVCGYFLLTGNGYIYLNGPDTKNQKWSEMFVLPSNYMEIISGGMFEPVKSYRLSYGYSDTPFPAEQVRHMKTFNPDFSLTGSQLYGLSPLRAYLLTLSKNKDTRVELNKQIKNGGVFGFISPDREGGEITAEQKADLKEQLIRAKRGNELMDRIFPSRQPLKYTQVGIPAADLQLIESLGLDRVDIANAFHVPIQLLNNTEASTDNNMGWAGKQLIYNAVMPVASKISDTLTKAICEPYKKRTGKNIIIEIDCTSLPEMQEDMGKVASYLAESYWLTPDEKRIAMGWGESGLPAMKKYYIPAGYRNIEDAAMTEDQFTNAFNNNE